MRLSDAEVKVAVLDDDVLLVDLLANWIRERDRWELVGHAASGIDGLSLCLATNPDLVLIDIATAHMDGAAGAERLRESLPLLRMIALTRHSDPYTIQRVQRLGLNGYVSKTGSLAVLETAIRRVMKGGSFFDETFLRSTMPLREPFAFHKILSDREIGILTLVAEGMPDPTIGRQLGISPYTVAAHRRNIRLKLGAHNDRDLTQYARKWGLAAAIA